MGRSRRVTLFHCFSLHSGVCLKEPRNHSMFLAILPCSAFFDWSRWLRCSLRWTSVGCVPFFLFSFGGNIWCSFALLLFKVFYVHCIIWSLVSSEDLLNKISTSKLPSLLARPQEVSTKPQFCLEDVLKRQHAALFFADGLSVSWYMN